LTILLIRCIINGVKEVGMMDTSKVTLTLPSTLLEELKAMVPPRHRSKVVAHALTEYVQEHKRRVLRERLKKGYQYRAARDKAIAEDWRKVEEKTWRKYVEDTTDV
jgi:metal-responsive CopG/Arc/MetJ family transcriptional regulator